MATRINPYQIEPGSNGQVLKTVGGVATWSTDDNSGVASADMVFNEVPAGTVNGVNTLFTLAAAALDDSHIRLYVDGVRQKESDDYTIAAASAITFSSNPPETGQNLLVDYNK